MESSAIFPRSRGSLVANRNWWKRPIFSPKLIPDHRPKTPYFSFFFSNKWWRAHTVSPDIKQTSCYVTFTKKWIKNHLYHYCEKNTHKRINIGCEKKYGKTHPSLPTNERGGGGRTLYVIAKWDQNLFFFLTYSFLEKDDDNNMGNSNTKQARFST